MFRGTIRIISSMGNDSQFTLENQLKTQTVE